MQYKNSDKVEYLSRAKSLALTEFGPQNIIYNDGNKSESGIENEVLGCNTLCQEEGIRALAMLKAAMAGEEVKAAEKKWNPNVKSTNVELIEAACGKKIELVDNEQSLPMSQKRKEKYD